MSRTDSSHTSSRLRAIGAGTALASVEALSYLSLKRYGEGLNSLPTVVLEEFPEINRELLEKFVSFDPELGWCPQPNTSQQKDTGDHLPGEEVRTVVTYSTDENGSRIGTVCERDPDADVTVSTYGDSYCFCREVNDDETFQNYLAKRLETHVGNYGGGNYGLDQALLRLKQNYRNDPTDYVVMTVTASSIARILSVWKHYQEFGNILAVKPRYVLENGSLELIETPIEEKTDLLDLEQHAEFLRTHDYHYEHWFKPHLNTFPYTSEVLLNSDHIRYLLYSGLMDIEKRIGASIPGIDCNERQIETAVRLERSRVEYHEKLFEEKADLFSAIIGEFVSFAEQEGFTPVFAMSQQLRYAKYEEEHGKIYGDFLERLDEQYPELTVIDMARHLDGYEDVESLYVERGEGGHYSPETNERIAEVLHDEVFE